MAVSIIESPSANAYPPTAAEVFRQQFTQLVQSLQSGDLSGAQQAYASLGQKHNGVNDPYAEVLSQIGQALLSGDLSGAQQALAPPWNNSSAPRPTAPIIAISNRTVQRR
jgi:hypothetical protein